MKMQSDQPELFDEIWGYAKQDDHPETCHHLWVYPDDENEIKEIEEILHKIIVDIRVLSKIHYTTHFKKMFESEDLPHTKQLFLSLEKNISAIETVFSYYTYMARKNYEADKQKRKLNDK